MWRLRLRRPREPARRWPRLRGGLAQSVAAPAAAPSPVATECAKLAAQIALYSVTDPAKAAVLRNELAAGTCDPLWAECLAIYEKWRLTSQAQPYINYQSIDDFVLEQCFPDNATIAVIGDWGTGMNDALVLLQQIAKNFEPDVLLHLGVNPSRTIGALAERSAALIRTEAR